MDGPTLWMVVFFTLIFAVVAILLAPPTFISDLFDGDRKKKKKQDWTEEE